MSTPSSPLETLRQLKEMLDAGTITPTEFEALKQKLVFADAPPATPPAPVLPPAAPVTPAPVVPVAPAPPQLTELYSPTLSDTPAGSPPVPPVVPPVSFEAAPVAYAAPEPIRYEPAMPQPEDVAPAYVAPAYAAPADEFEELSKPLPRNPLNLVLSIAGLLALLGLVLYLSFNNRSSEHLTSTSQTAADSLAAPIETGPQAEQIELAPAAAPETVRLAPATPPPAAPPRPAPAPRDSVQVAPSTTAEPDTAI